MATYDYRCASCDFIFEVVHPMSESPEVVCPKCSTPKAVKVPSLFGMVVNAPKIDNHIRETGKRHTDIRSDLKSYGVEELNPLGSSVESVYGEIKARGSEVKDKMQATKELKAKENQVKSRAWKEKALKNMTERRLIKKDKLAKEDAAKRKIVL